MNPWMAGWILRSSMVRMNNDMKKLLAELMSYTIYALIILKQWKY